MEHTGMNKLFFNMMCAYLIAAIPAVSGCRSIGNTGPDSGPAQAAYITASVQKVLDAMDRDLAVTARRLAIVGLESDKTRLELRDLLKKHPEVIDCCTVSAEGVMLAVEPEAYRKSEGADISDQEQIIRLHATDEAVLSGVFKAVEGFHAVDLEYPVRNDDGSLKGSVSMLIRPELFLDRIVTGLRQQRHGSCWIMQPDGLILYDPDRLEIGRNLFRDPLYTQFPELIGIGRRIAASRAGRGSYRYYGTGHLEFSEKDCWWDTAGLHGTEWRIVVVHERD
jgi:hypothetical protein